MRWFTSDTHFGHKNVLIHCNRPFSDIQEHDEELIRRWNEVVHPKDTVYHLGDICFGGKEYTKDIISRLNGQLVLIIGNHDHQSARYYIECGAHDVFQWKEIKDLRYYITHYPFCHKLYSFDNEGFNWKVLHGHTHAKTCREEGLGTALINVGVDAWNYYPVSENTLETIRGCGYGE